MGVTLPRRHAPRLEPLLRSIGLLGVLACAGSPEGETAALPAPATDAGHVEKAAATDDGDTDGLWALTADLTALDAEEISRRWNTDPVLRELGEHLPIVEATTSSFPWNCQDRAKASWLGSSATTVVSHRTFTCPFFVLVNQPFLLAHAYSALADQLAVEGRCRESGVLAAFGLSTLSAALCSAEMTPEGDKGGTWTSLVLPLAASRAASMPACGGFHALVRDRLRGGLDRCRSTLMYEPRTNRLFLSNEGRP